MILNGLIPRSSSSSSSSLDSLSSCACYHQGCHALELFAQLHQLIYESFAGSVDAFMALLPGDRVTLLNR